MSILEQVREDANAAMKAGERERSGALRLIADALHQDTKLGAGDEIAVLQRERKKRLEAAEAYRDAGREQQAASEEAEAEAIASYLPEQLSDEELTELVASAIEETRASEQKDMGKVMGVLMPRVGAKADGKRVSQAVREKLGA